jgi:hypothetical protein
VVVGATVVDEGADEVVDNSVVVVVTATVVEIFWLLLSLFVGGRNSNTKAATMPKPAITASTLAPTDHLVSDDLSSSGGGGASSEGGGP